MNSNNNIIPELILDPIRVLKDITSTAKNNRRILISIAGVPGSGKTTLADELKRDYLAATSNDPNSVAVLSIDGFHKTRDELQKMKNPEEAFRRRGAPWTFDGIACGKRLHDVKYSSDYEIKWPSFDHAVKDPIPDSIVISPLCKLVIVEGIWTLHRSDGFETLEGIFDRNWYLDTPREVANERLAKRHMLAWNLTREEADERIAVNDLINGNLVEAGRLRADGLILGAIRS
jgi:pantothenate kinase